MHRKGTTMHIGTAYKLMNTAMIEWRDACRKVADIDHDLKMDAVKYIRVLHGLTAQDEFSSRGHALVESRWKMLKRDSIVRKDAIDAAQWAAAQHAMYAAHVSAAMDYQEWSRYYSD